MDMFKGLAIFGIVLLIIGLFVFIDAIIVFNSCEEKVIEGVVTNVEVYNDYLDITFNDNDTYQIAYPSGWGTESVDLTVNSKLVVKMHRFTKDGIIIKIGDNWVIDSIVKIGDR